MSRTQKAEQEAESRAEQEAEARAEQEAESRAEHTEPMDGSGFDCATVEKKYDIPTEESYAADAVATAVKRPLASTLLKITLIVLVIFAIIVFITAFIKYRELQYDIESLRGEISQKQDSIEEKEYLLDIPSDDKDYIIRMVKEKLGLFLPDEIIYYSDLND